jgi:hypothetical protein
MLIMHIPPRKQRVHWNNTAPIGTCALVALAQVCELLLNQSFRAVPKVTAEDETWMAKMLQPLKASIEGADVILGAEVLAAWTYHGLSQVEEDKTIDPNREAPTSKEWIFSDQLVEMAVRLHVNVNVWLAIYTEVQDLDDEHINHVTKYSLNTVIRDGKECDLFGITVSQVVDWFSESSVDIIQTQDHYFVHPDSSEIHKRLVETLMAAIDR